MQFPSPEITKVPQVSEFTPVDYILLLEDICKVY